VSVQDNTLCWLCDREASLTDVLDMAWCTACWDQADEDAARIFRDGTWE